MTPTTDLQKLLDLIDETKDSRQVWHHSLAEAEQALENAAREIAARVLELEAENGRLREGLINIDALAPLRELMRMMHPDAISGLVLRMGEIARTALKGGEI